MEEILHQLYTWQLSLAISFTGFLYIPGGC